MPFASCQETQNTFIALISPAQAQTQTTRTRNTHTHTHTHTHTQFSNQKYPHKTQSPNLSRICLSTSVFAFARYKCNSIHFASVCSVCVCVDVCIWAHSWHCACAEGRTFSPLRPVPREYTDTLGVKPVSPRCPRDNTVPATPHTTHTRVHGLSSGTDPAGGPMSRHSPGVRRPDHPPAPPQPTRSQWGAAFKFSPTSSIFG